jgi:carbon monoxide dehydrogenase subunit G
MKIDNEFTVSVPVDEAWKVLTDLEGVAPCLPGAKLTGVDGDVYSGKVKIKVGPVVSEYAGTARFAAKDDAAYHAVIDAKGKDSRGAGNAAATIDARCRPDGEHTVVTVSTDLNITGKIAQFGSGVIKEVSAKLLGQFVDNLEARLLAPAGPETTEPTAEPETQVPTTAPDAGTQAPAPTAAAVTTPAVGPTVTTTFRALDAEPEALDLMSLAGASIYQRLIPVAVAAAVAAVIGYVLGRTVGR